MSDSPSTSRELEAKIFKHQDDVVKSQEFFYKDDRGSAARVLRGVGFDVDDISLLFELWTRVPVPVKTVEKTVIKERIIYRPTKRVSANSRFLIKVFGEEPLKKLSKELKIDWKDVNEVDFPLVWASLEKSTGVHYGTSV